MERVYNFTTYFSTIHFNITLPSMLRCPNNLFTLKMEPALSSEMLVSYHITTWCNNPEDYDLNLSQSYLNKIKSRACYMFRSSCTFGSITSKILDEYILRSSSLWNSPCSIASSTSVDQVSPRSRRDSLQFK